MIGELVRGKKVGRTYADDVDGTSDLVRAGVDEACT